MSDKDRIVIQKMIGYARKCIAYAANSTFESFMEDDKTVSACAFAIGQLGEMVSNLSDETRAANQDLIPWQFIRGIRNRIVHDYENIDLTILWGTIHKSLPELIAHLTGMLEAQANV
ncbi:MAG: DUF86 domain-containing protein [Oscillospiraceae bacterium]|jgi:uncharacterized protein with HEPN domain|nr:DUF86 domain-containing protein [Oscillospiraceae bacterium]